MFDTTTAPRGHGGAPTYLVTANGAPMPFGIDDGAFTAWVLAEGNELVHHLPNPADASPGSTLADLIYRALSARVITGDPGIEVNIHGHADGAGYFIRLNNRAGRQLLVGLTRGRHELNWPPSNLTPIEGARRYLLEVCCIVNALLTDLSTAPV